MLSVKIKIENIFTWTVHKKPFTKIQNSEKEVRNQLIKT